MSIFKACDIRGVFGKELTLEHAAALGSALAARTTLSDVVVAGDGRTSTPALKSALVRALVASGKRVLDLGMVPTPAFYFALRKLEVPVGVMVTASHNPAVDNGFKIVLGDLPIREIELEAIRAFMESPARAAAAEPGEVVPVPVLDDYVAFVKTNCPRRGKLKVVIDAANGVLGSIAPLVFRELGYPVVELFTEINGEFPNHPPNPAVASNLSALCAEVRESRADLGVAYDGDGDRVAFVDERGEPVENDRIIVLLARAALADRPAATIVYDQKCSDVVREEITRAGGIALMERSGYAFIKTALLQTGAAYAGELSGHHFFAGIGGDDGLIASLKTAALLQASAGTFSQIVAGIPRYPITPDIRLRMPPEEVDAIIAALRRDLSAIEINTMDGVHARFADGWGMARASVTESAITLRFEGRTPEALKRIRHAFAEIAPQLAGKL